jgi:hypothetical protein
VPSYVPPEKNIAYVFYVSLISQANTKIAQANPTLAAGDVKVATDDAAPANLATLPAVDADFTKRVKVSLSTSEMNGDNVTVIFSDAAGSEWCDLTVNIQTVARQLDDLAWPTTAGRSIDVTAGGNVGIDWNNVETPGATVDLSDTSINLCDTVTTTATATALTTNNDKTGYALSAAGVDAIWDEVITGHATADSFGKVFDDQIDGLRAYGDGAWATAVGFSTHSAGDVWAVDATTQQTAGTFGETLGDSAALGTTVHAMATSILDDTGTSGVQVADKSGYALSSAGVDAIWDEVITGHATADSFGKVFDDQIDGLRTYGDTNWATAVGFSTHSAADAADAVWDEDMTAHQGAGTAGETLGDSAALGTTIHGMATSILEDTGTTLDGRIPAALVGGKMDSDMTAISGDTSAADRLEVLADADGRLHAVSYGGPRGPGVYLNDAAANTNTVNGVDGTITNPVSTIAAAKTIADSMSFDRIYLVNDSAITLAATMTDYEFVGIGEAEGNTIDYEFVGIGEAEGNTIALASQDVSGSAFYNVAITGVQGGSSRARFEDCEIGTATLHLNALRCGFTDSVTGITFSNNDDNILDGCFSMVPGNATPIFICSAANLDLSVRHYSGGVELKTLNATATVSIETDGQVIFNADCNTGADVTMRGMLSITDNTGGMSNLTIIATFQNALDDGTATYDRTTDSLQALRDHIGDGTNLTEAGGTGDHLTATLSADVVSISGDTTAADRLEGLMDGIILAQVNDAAATTTAFAADGFTEATDDHFNGRLITFVSGNLTGQQTDITDYDAAGGAQGNQEFTVTALTEAPGQDDWFVIH